MTSKYRNIKTKRILNNEVYVFDSKREAVHFDKLISDARIGLISDLVVQPKYDLIPAMFHNGKTLRKITYSADFRYLKDGMVYVIDVKGMETDVYKIKKRLFLQKNPDVIFLEVR